MYPQELVNRRWLRVHFDIRTFAGVIVEGALFKMQLGLPVDARLVRWFPDPISDSLTFVFEHESFAVVGEGEDIPLALPGLISVYDETKCTCFD